MIRRIIGEGTGYGPGAYLGLKHFSERRDHARKPKTHHRGERASAMFISRSPNSIAR